MKNSGRMKNSKILGLERSVFFTLINSHEKVKQ